MQRLEAVEVELAEAQETNQKLRDEIQTTSDDIDDREGLERAVRDLEEQLTALGRSERVALQRLSQLEEEMRNQKIIEEVCVLMMALLSNCCLATHLCGLQQKHVLC